MSTMAMQRARPTMIRPVRYSGRSGSSSQASANIRAGPEHPVQDQRECRATGGRGDVAELVVPDLGQHRVHHHQQADRDRQGDGVDLDRVERVVEAVDHAAEEQPDDHRDADPHRQQPVEGGEPLEHRIGGRSGRGVVDGVAHAMAPSRGWAGEEEVAVVKRLPSAAMASGRAM